MSPRERKKFPLNFPDCCCTYIKLVVFVQCCKDKDSSLPKFLELILCRRELLKLQPVPVTVSQESL